MTLTELRNDVARLGFESHVEDEECFIASANRALSLIYIDRPVSKTARISFSGPRTTLVREFFEHNSGIDIIIPINGKGISFITSGNGSCTIEDEVGSCYVPLSGKNQVTKQMLHGRGTVTFSGSYYYTVSSLAVYEELKGNRITDVPDYTPYIELDPEDYCDGFRAFSGYPKDSKGRTVKTVELRDGRIRAPFDFRGELFLTYYRTPALISANSPNAKIDVSEECAPMLPLLTASFLWLDDDAAKAQYYMSLYRDLVANVKRYASNRVDTKYNDNGWV